MKYLILPFLLSSCATSSLNRQAAEFAEQIHEAHNAALVAPGAPYLADAFLPPERQKTEKDFCQGVRKGCDAKMEEALHLRWKERYPGAIWSTFMDHCKAYPADCRDLRLFETHLRKAHNEAVEFSRRQKLAQLEENRRSIEASEEARRAAAMPAFIMGAAAAVQPQAAPQPRNATCTTYGNGQYGQVNCSSF